MLTNKNIDIKDTILNLGSDCLKVFGGKFQGGIHLQQSIEEIVGLIEFLFEQDRKYHNFLEVGSAAGGNTFLFNYFFDLDKIYIIDDNKHKKHHLRSTILNNIIYQEYIGNSQSIDAKDFIGKQNLLFDIIFIDADHSYGGVKNDIENFKDFLMPAGFLIFHDTNCCIGVKNATNELKNDQSFVFINEFLANSGPKLGIGVFQKQK